MPTTIIFTLFLVLHDTTNRLLIMIKDVFITHLKELKNLFGERIVNEYFQKDVKMKNSWEYTTKEKNC